MADYSRHFSNTGLLLDEALRPVPVPDVYIESRVNTGTVQIYPSEIHASPLSPVAVVVDLRWGDRTLVSRTADLRWGVRSVVSQAADLRWRDRALVAQTADLRWQDRALVQQAVDLRWRDRQTATTSSDLRWRDRALVAATRDLRWQDRALVGPSADLEWRLRQAVSSLSDLRWNDRLTVQMAADLRWGILESVAQSADLRWALKQVTHVDVDIDLRWRIFSLRNATVPYMVREGETLYAVTEYAGDLSRPLTPTPLLEGLVSQPQPYVKSTDEHLAEEDVIHPDLSRGNQTSLAREVL